MEWEREREKRRKKSQRMLLLFPNYDYSSFNLLLQINKWVNPCMNESFYLSIPPKEKAERSIHPSFPFNWMDHKCNSSFKDPFYKHCKLKPCSLYLSPEFAFSVSFGTEKFYSEERESIHSRNLELQNLLPTGRAGSLLHEPHINAHHMENMPTKWQHSCFISLNEILWEKNFPAGHELFLYEIYEWEKRRKM